MQNFFSSCLFFFHPWCVVCPKVLDYSCFFQSACTSIPFGIQIPLLPVMCAYVCTRLCTGVCAHICTWSFWDTPATTAVLCGRVSCHPFTNNLLSFYLGVFHAFPQQQQRKNLVFGCRKELFLDRTVEYMSNIYTYYIIHICSPFLDLKNVQNCNGTQCLQELTMP